MASEVAPNVGFGRSDGKVYRINSLEGNASRVDLQRPYAFIVICCEDAAGIAANTTMTCKVSPDDGVALMDVYEQNDPDTLWSKAIPATGTFYFMLTHAFGAKFVQPILDIATTAEVTMLIYGYDSAVINQPDR